MENQTQKNRIDVLIEGFVKDHKLGLFTFEEFLQSLKKVLSGLFTDIVIEKSILTELLFAMLKENYTYSNKKKEK